MDLSDVLVAILAVAGGVFLLGLALIGYFMWRYRIPPRGVAALVGALVYLASPVDVLPEVLLGPLGLVDDAGILTAAVLWAYRLVKAREKLQEVSASRGRRPSAGS